MIKKRLHGIIGSVLSKNKEGNYTLNFPEFNESAVYSRWDDVVEELEVLRQNEVENDRQTVQ